MSTKRNLGLLGIYISLFTNSLMFTIVFPMASQMIMYFGLVENRTETGYWVGMLGGVMMLGRFISSPFWGYLCDKWGRKPVLMLGILCTSILSVLFGMSTSFVWALTTRFLQGLLSPITVATRTIIGEMYSGNQQASAMSCYTLIGSFGSISGNIVGGFFQFPGDLEFMDTTIFSSYPFLLPNLLTGVIGFVSLVICYFFLIETKTKDSLIESQQPRNYWELMKDPLVIQVLVLFSACSFNGTAFNELMVLWAWADKSNGGFELTPEELGILSASTSFLLIFYMRTFYKKIVDNKGLIKTVSWSLRVNMVVIIILPILSFLRYEFIIKWALLIFGVLFYNTFDFMGLTSTLIMINNSVNTLERGKINGISMALGNLARGFSPPLFGITFAYTAQRGLSYPFNFAFSHFLLSFFIFLAWVSSTKIDSSTDNPKVTLTKTVSSEMVPISIIQETEID
jgi:MFS family permease